MVDDVLDGFLLGGVEAANVDVDVGEGFVDLGLVGAEVIVCKITQIDGSRAVFGELMGGGTANA